MLMTTIAIRDVVIAMVSARGVENTAALIKPVRPSIEPTQKAIFASFRRKFPCVSELSVPTANPRMTKIIREYSKGGTQADCIKLSC